MSHDVYESPLAGRYASPYMLHLFSPDMRFQTWRRLWTALARAQHQLGLPVTEEQVRQLEQHITDIDYDTARRREREVRHDVMAHVYTYGKAAPLAAGIIHLGATMRPLPSSPQLIPTIAQFDMSSSPHLYYNRIFGGFPPPTAPYYTQWTVRSKE